jgi:lysozyme
MRVMPIPGTDSIIDLSHWNTINDFAEVKASGVSAVIHKASQGLGSDPKFHGRALAFESIKVPVGAYHFGVQSSDPVEQADYLISVAGKRILALDWEWNNADTMTADQAFAFVNRVRNKTGRWPLIYTSAAFLATIPRLIGWRHFGVPLVDTSMLNCDLWLTGFTPSPVIPQQWATKGYRIWQHGIGSCAGIQGQVDRDTFGGTAEELAAYFGA